MEDLEADITRNGGTFDKRIRVGRLQVFVRVVIKVRAPLVQSWAMSIILDGNGRIDGIDWEARVNDHRGKAHHCKGWHRHMWKPGTLDTHKECLPDFDPGLTAREFIFAGFKVLNVRVQNSDRRRP